MKRTLLITAVAAVLSLGIANAAGDYVDAPIVLKSTDAAVQVKAGKTTYVQMTQDPAAWRIDPTASNFEVFVDDDGYAPTPTKALNDWFWVLDEGTPANWAIFVPKSESTLKGNVQNVYGFRVPAGTPAGTYNLQIKVRDNLNGSIYTFPLAVTVSGDNL